MTILQRAARRWAAGPARGSVPMAVAALVLVACGRDGSDTAPAGGDRASGPRTAPATVLRCDADAAREVVVRFGERLQRVPTTAEDEVVSAAVREHYGDLVTPGLLAAWTRNPDRAPGREVSSPWPDRIEIREIDDDDGACDVEGEIVYVTSVEAGTGGAVARESVELTVVRGRDGEWRIAEVERHGYLPRAVSGPDSPRIGATPASPADRGREPTLAEDTRAAVEVVRRYHDAIAAGDYRAAYLLWSDGGARSGKSLEEFAAGFAGTARIVAEIGQPGPVEGAAGSRYITIPVEIRATTTSGAEQRFSGTYTLRRSVIDGATAEQRQWRITGAEIVER